jgi:hypothetical protein
MAFHVDLNGRRGFSFFEKVAGVMALLKLKGKYDECAFSSSLPTVELLRADSTFPVSCR